MHYETNLFVIENAADLKARFRRCRVRGLNREHIDYYRNTDRLRGLARDLKRPVTVIEERGELYLILPADIVTVPSQYPLIGCVAQLEMEDTVFELDFASPAREHREIALNFIRHAAENRLIANRALWRPKAGQGFLERVPEKIGDQILRYNGFRVRPIPANDGTLALCVDAAVSHTTARPLPRQLSRDRFAREIKGRHCIYRFGDRWYEVVVSGLSDFTVERHTFLLNGKPRKLLEHILEEAEKPLGPDLVQLRGDESVVTYINYQGEQRAMPTTLCFPVVGSAELRRHHASTLLDPQDRRPKVAAFVKEYLDGFTLDGVSVRLAQRGLQSNQRILPVPDIELGGKHRLSVSSAEGATNVGLADLGKQRAALLRDPRYGFYQKDALDHQIFIMPRSLHDSFGAQFLKDLGKEVDAYLGASRSYEPQVIVYNDTGKRRRFALQAHAILEAVDQAAPRPGYALAMIHRPEDQKRGEEDPLAALISQRLRDIYALQTAVIHTDTATRAYQEIHTPSGRQYRADPNFRRFPGYLRNVALSHVLLNNQRWPYVLAKPLHADVVIGIDVKSNTCGLLAVGRNGRDVRFQSYTSGQKERLLEGQIGTYLMNILTAEHHARSAPITSVVIHRDGRAFASELRGIAKAATKLRRDGVLTNDAEVTVLEIGKSSAAPLRLFRVVDERRAIQNPSVGAWYPVDESEAYLCTTGWPFLRQGTAHPLHIQRVFGSMPIEKLAEDVYALSTLAWTQPETCSRTPITLRLTDRFLTGEAGEYNADAFAFHQFDEEETTA